MDLHLFDGKPGIAETLGRGADADGELCDVLELEDATVISADDERSHRASGPGFLAHAAKA